MSAIKNILGVSTILGKTGSIDVSSLTGKKVMLYFSASWCPPCRGFTPVLSEYYTKHKDTKGFDIIFMSWDEELEDFDGYYAKHPWLAMKYDDAQSKMEDLNKKYGVESIPTIIIVDADTGDVISKNARAMIPKDPDAKEFPYKE
eukprot:Tbor_TRINITY_DN3978_c0_g1::TRINITY_DN3978_c0_g1_i2::g.706::m.706/K17609/NXN; nucleoredoxin